MNKLRAEPAETVLIGDSVTDVQVAHATGVHAVGYAKTAARGRELEAAGAELVIARMNCPTQAARTTRQE